MPNFSAHSMHFSFACVSWWQAVGVSFEKDKSLVSSAYAVAQIPGIPRKDSYRGAVYSMNSKGESGDPCGTPALMCISLDV